MEVFEIILLIMLIVCAVVVAFTKNSLVAIIIFMAYSLVMSVIWMILESPDLAITEAAVGAGVTSLLFFVALKKIHALKSSEEEKNTVTVNEESKTNNPDSANEERTA